MTGAPGFDPKAQAGKVPAPARSIEVLVVGGGTAGAGAAIEAAKAGAKVLLIDENPISAGLMGLDVPLWWGGRYTGAVRTGARMTEQVFIANPALEAAIEAGVEVELGVCCWGVWVPGPGLASLPTPLAGLANEDRAWMVGFDRLILATGARDVALAFPGWDQPGVMGARAFHALATTYDAFAGRRLVILGSGDLAFETAELALARGLEVGAIIEVAETVQGAPVRAAALAAAGVAILTGHVPLAARGGIDGVERIVLRDRGGAEHVLFCDTIVEAIGLVPVVELLDVLGPGAPEVSLVGDAAGVPDADALVYRAAWSRALAGAGGEEVLVCQCEAVTRGDLLGLRPPAYLGPPSPAQAARNLAGLLADGPADLDHVKRLTRAGMGPCQGRRCREQTALILAEAETGRGGAPVPPAGYRAPVRPLPLNVLADWDEARAMSAHWDVWFGIPGQWTPYADIGTDRESLYDGLLGGDAHL